MTLFLNLKQLSPLCLELVIETTLNKQMPRLGLYLRILFLEYIIYDELSIAYYTNISCLFRLTFWELFRLKPALCTVCQTTELTILCIFNTFIQFLAAIAFWLLFARYITNWLLHFENGVIKSVIEDLRRNVFELDYKLTLLFLEIF